MLMMLESWAPGHNPLQLMNHDAGLAGVPGKNPLQLMLMMLGWLMLMSVPFVIPNAADAHDARPVGVSGRNPMRLLPMMMGWFGPVGKIQCG